MRLLILFSFIIFSSCHDKVSESENIKSRTPKFITFEERKEATKFLNDIGINPKDPAKLIESFTTFPDESLIKNYLDSGFYSPYLSPMVEAAATGNMNIIKYLVEERGMNVNVHEAARTSPLNAAIQAQHHEVVDYLLKNGASPNVEDEYGRTPLMTAVKNHDFESVKKLISNKVDVNKPDLMGNTPLMYAASRGDKHIFNTLLNNGANPHAMNLFKSNLVHAAANGGNPEILRILIQRNVSIDLKDVRGDTPIMIAIASYNIPQIDLFLENGSSVYKVDKDGDSLLNIAIRSAFDAEADIEDKAEILNMKAQEDLPYRTDLVLHRAYLIVLRLLNHHADPNIQGRDKATPLMLAGILVHGGIIDALIGQNADLNLKDKNGDTALHYAVEGGNPFNVEKLFSAGANPKIQNKKGETPMTVARKLGYASVIQSLNKNYKQAQEQNTK